MASIFPVSVWMLPYLWTTIYWWLIDLCVGLIADISVQTYVCICNRYVPEMIANEVCAISMNYVGTVLFCLHSFYTSSYTANVALSLFWEAWVCKHFKRKYDKLHRMLPIQQWDLDSGGPWCVVHVLDAEKLNEYALWETYQIIFMIICS
jgi:hypothetical protein